MLDLNCKVDKTTKLLWILNIMISWFIVLLTSLSQNPNRKMGQNLTQLHASLVLILFMHIWILSAIYGLDSTFRSDNVISFIYVLTISIVSSFTLFICATNSSLLSNFLNIAVLTLFLSSVLLSSSRVCVNVSLSNQQPRANANVLFSLFKRFFRKLFNFIFTVTLLPEVTSESCIHNNL